MYDSHVRRNELFIATATLGAHASIAPEQGFRQRDVRFLIELFSNWVETSFQERVLDIQNNQVKRYIEVLEGEGFARKLKRKGAPCYRLTRTGLIELLSRCVGQTYTSHREQFFFLYYFIRAYKPRLEDIVLREGKLFPTGLKIELESLLDVDALLQREQDAAQKERRKLEIRVQEARESSQLVCQRLESGMPFSEVVLEVQKKHPYELNSQKPLLELLGSVPEAYREWELTSGNLQRLKYIWEPALKLLEGYCERLESLK